MANIKKKRYQNNALVFFAYAIWYPQAFRTSPEVKPIMAAEKYARFLRVHCGKPRLTSALPFLLSLVVFCRQESSETALGFDFRVNIHWNSMFSVHINSASYCFFIGHITSINKYLILFIPHHF